MIIGEGDLQEITNRIYERLMGSPVNFQTILSQFNELKSRMVLLESYLNGEEVLRIWKDIPTKEDLKNLSEKMDEIGIYELKQKMKEIALICGQVHDIITREYI